MILVPLEIFVSPKPCFLYRVIFLPEPRIMGGPRVTAYIVVDDWGFSRSRSCSAWSLSHLLRAILCCFVVGLLCHHIRACSPKKAIGKTQGTKVGPVERLPLFSDVTTHHSLQILAAYMMKKYSWGLRKTMEFLSSRRPGTAIWPEYSWFALIFLASFKKRQCFFFFFGWGQETAIALGSSVAPDLDLKPAFLQQLLGFERRGTYAKCHWEDGFFHLETIVMSQGFFLWGFFWNTSFFFHFLSYPVTHLSLIICRG